MRSLDTRAYLSPPVSVGAGEPLRLLSRLAHTNGLNEESNSERHQSKRRRDTEDSALQSKSHCVAELCSSATGTVAGKHWHQVDPAEVRMEIEQFPSSGQPLRLLPETAGVHHHHPTSRSSVVLERVNLATCEFPETAISVVRPQGSPIIHHVQFSSPWNPKILPSST